MRRSAWLFAVAALGWGSGAWAQGAPAGSAPAAPQAAPATQPAAGAPQEAKPPAKAAGDVTAEVKVCKSVEARECKDEGASFTSDVGALSCWSAIQGMKDGGKVLHKWFVGDQEAGTVTLNVGAAPRWRTYSTKSIDPSAKGDWRVDVTDEGGTVLGSAKFKIE